LRYLGCVWLLVYGPARPVGCIPRPIGCLDDLLILSRGMQTLGSSLHPRKRISPPFLGVQALASARGLRGCAREVEKLGAASARTLGSLPPSRHLLRYKSPVHLTSLHLPLAQCF
jgi:hypothetical protein